MKIYEDTLQRLLYCKMVRQLFAIIPALHRLVQPSFYRLKKPVNLSAQVRCVSAGRHFVL